MKHLGWICLLSMILTGPVAAQGLEGRIVFVDLERLFNEFHKTRLADAQLKEMAEEYNDERANLIQEFEDMNERFTEAREQAQDPALSEDVRTRQRDAAEELLVDLREFEERIQRFDQSRRQQLEEQGRRMRTRLVSEIKEEIRRYARGQGVSAVVDSSGQSMNAVENVLFVDSRFDITEIMLETINKGRPAPTP